MRRPLFALAPASCALAAATLLVTGCGKDPNQHQDHFHVFPNVLPEAPRALSQAPDATTAARAIGTSPSKILFREVIPNVLPTLLSYAMVAAAFVIVVEGSLSFLGLSVQLPQSTWGNMINQARRDIRVDVWQVLWPSLALTLTVLSLNQVGDWFQQRSAVRDAAL